MTGTGFFLEAGGELPIVPVTGTLLVSTEPDVAMPAPDFQRDYRDHWQGFVRRFGGPA